MEIEPTPPPAVQKIFSVSESSVVDGQSIYFDLPSAGIYTLTLIDKETGKIKWEKTVTREMPIEDTHKLGSWASNSPCTDGKHIYAYFGSRGIFCLDFEGNIRVRYGNLIY